MLSRAPLSRRTNGAVQAVASAHAIRSDVLHGPWRAVPVLGITQIIAWGTIFYSPVLTVPLIAAERGWSLSFAMGGFSLCLLVAGLVSPFVGRDDRPLRRPCRDDRRLADRRARPARRSLYAEHRVSLSRGLDAARRWASRASLYDPAFATLGRIFGAAARSPITVLTLAGGFASTVGWPSTHLLMGAVGWRGTYLVYAALLALVCAPLHAFALPRSAPHPRNLPADGDGQSARAAAAARHGLRAGHRGLRQLRLRAVGAVRASARDLRPHRHRCRDGRA